MWNYTEAVHDHFLRPHNVGPLEGANAIGEVGSLTCGDALKLYLKINDQHIIEDASFETFGCASAIASSSVLTDMVKGMSVEDALKITNKDITNALGGLPKQKMHCSVMGQEALEAAIRQWKGEPPVPHAHEEGKLVCKCFGITDAQIIRAITENGLKTVEEITNYTMLAAHAANALMKSPKFWLVSSSRSRWSSSSPSRASPTCSACRRCLRPLTKKSAPSLPLTAAILNWWMWTVCALWSPCAGVAPSAALAK